MSNYNLRDAKTKYDYPAGVISGKEEDGYYQQLEFTVDALPEISMWQVGEEYTLVIKVKEKRHELVKDGEKVKEKAFFEVLEVGTMSTIDTEYRDKVKDKLK